MGGFFCGRRLDIVNIVRKSPCWFEENVWFTFCGNRNVRRWRRDNVRNYDLERVL